MQVLLYNIFINDCAHNPDFIYYVLPDKTSCCYTYRISSYNHTVHIMEALQTESLNNLNMFSIAYFYFVVYTTLNFVNYVAQDKC